MSSLLWDYLTYNAENGFLEAMVHGKKNGILKVSDYYNLTQCDSLDQDFRMHLSSTEYGTFLQNVPSPLNENIILEKATERLVETFNEYRYHAVKPLSTFLDYITYEYMIDNVTKLITGIHKRRGALELMYKCHPLGIFDTLGAITAASTIDEMYQIVLIDSPIGKFFTKTDKRDFTELSMDYMKNMLRKNYLESFYDFCKSIGGITEEVMSEILEFEADRTVLTITRNSFRLKDLQPNEKKNLYPNFGSLVDVHDELCNAKSDHDIKAILRDGKLDSGVGTYGDPVYKEYSEMFERATRDTHSGKEQVSSFERVFTEKAIDLYKSAFNQQMHYGVFYAYIKLMEQEISNLFWIAACIFTKDKSRINEYTPIY